MEYRIRKRYKKKRRHFIRRVVISIVAVAVLILVGRKFTPNTAIDLENLYSPYSILTDLDSGNALAEHNAQDRIYPASLTKIMTAILAI